MCIRTHAVIVSGAPSAGCRDRRNPLTPTVHLPFTPHGGCVAMDAMLECDACGVTVGPFGSYEQWSDAASRLGWWVGEDHVLCSLCSGRP